MDITKKGWKCDCCGKEYYEGDWGYASKYSVTIKSHSNIHIGKSGTYDEICSDCIDGIIGILEPANIN